MQTVNVSELLKDYLIYIMKGSTQDTGIEREIRKEVWGPVNPIQTSLTLDRACHASPGPQDLVGNVRKLHLSGKNHRIALFTS